jgi:sucrose synthase
LQISEVGLEKGWAALLKYARNFLSEVLQAPNTINIENFFSRVSFILKIVVFSINDYFGQENILGFLDTGG